MPVGAFQERTDRYRATVEPTGSDASNADDMRVANHEREQTASGTVTSLLDRLFDGSLGDSGMAA
jgi:hypothetical protein